MADAASDVFAYGLVAGLSGTAFLATVILLGTERGVANVLALLAGIVLVLAGAVVVAALAADLVVGAGGQLWLTSVIKLALGLFLLSLAWRVRPSSGGGPALQAKLAGMDAKLQRLQPASAWRVGIGVAVLPKRLMITVLAGVAIGAGESMMPQAFTLAALYVLTATMLVWGTLLVYVLGGATARTKLDAGRVWVTDHIAVLALAVASLFGLLFTGQALMDLLARLGS
jgi:hypothetical protein